MNMSAVFSLDISQTISQVLLLCHTCYMFSPGTILYVCRFIQRYALCNTKMENTCSVQTRKKLSAYTWQDLGEILFLEANYMYMYICGNKMPTRCNRWYLLQILLLAQHVSCTIIPIIRSSRVLYRWSLSVVFGALVFKLSVWCGAEGYVSGLRAAALVRQAATACIILSSSWWWAQWCPKHVEQAIRSAIKIICCI